jgi:outer membrane protein
MKHLLVLLFVAGSVCTAAGVKAQAKIGYISLQELILAMPEYKTAEKDMEDYRQALIEQGNDYQKAFMLKDSIFKVDSFKWTVAVRDIKRKEINELYLRWANFNQEAQKLMNQREQDLLAPIQQKAVQTTQAVAKENGYSYVLSKEQLISFPATDDMFPLVAKKLNLKTETKPAAPAPTTAPKTGGK